MARCNEYKPSGFDWISDISNKWDVKRLRFVCEFRNGYTPSKANPDFWTDGTIPWYRMEDIRDSGRYLNEAKQYITEDAVKGGGLFDAGSFILATTATIGEHAVLIVDSLANQRFTNLKIRKSLTDYVRQDFFFYYLYVIDNYCKSTTNTATFASVNMNDLRNVPVPIPPIDEQKVIVDFIEKKCASIDKVIATQEQRIALLEELKQSIITEAVTRGLNSDAPLRDSGIEWIGKIPEHWKTIPLKFTGSFGNGLTYHPEDIVESDGILVLRSSNIQEDVLDFEDTVYVNSCPDFLMVCPGDIIICSRNGSASLVGKCAMINENINATFGAFMMRYRPYKNPRFGFYLLQAALKMYKGLYSTTTINQLTMGVIAQIHVALPPINEQDEIANYLGRKCARIDSAIAKAKREVELLREFKQSVITEAVTGKIKVC